MADFRTRGHPAALRFVERAVRSGRPPHALLISGPDRVGKTTLALDLAAGLLCLDPQVDRRPCRACAACRKVDHGNHPDLHVLAPEGAGLQIRVGQVHSLAAQLALLPLEGRFRVAIVEQAHRLNLDAQNALLKTLEEPPTAVALVLAADDSATLLPTVISRCARLRLAPVAPDVIAELLDEAGLADMARGTALARLAGGRPGAAVALAGRPEAALGQSRLARSLLDLLTADRRRRLAMQAELLDDGALLAAAVAGDDESDAGEGDDAVRGKRAARSGRGSSSAGQRRSPAERRAAVAQVLTVWREVARDLALAARGGRSELRQPELLDDLTAAAALVDAPSVARFLARLESVGRALDAYANPELALDVLLLEWPRSRQAA